MRACQICDATGKRVILNNYHEFKGICLFACTSCGHRYVDGLELSQSFFDNYYLNKYITDDKPYSEGRLSSLAAFVASECKSVLDIGGTDGELRKHLEARGVVCDVAGVGVDYPYHEGVILSHVLEHVYDLSELFCHITCDKIFVEIPIHLEYVEPTKYDLHWQHINKFRPQDIETLLRQKGYTVSISKQIEDYREYKVWRIAGIREGS
jgi:hypothetical protein